MVDFDASAATWDADPRKVERALRVAALIADEVPDLGWRRVLEYGCGTGLLGFALRPRVGAVVLADSSPGMLAEVERKIVASGFADMTPLRLDLATDPPPAGRFDLVCSLMTLHHVKDTAGLLAALRGLLGPRGVLCLSDLDAEDGSFHGPEVDVHHGFDRERLGRLLVQAGFSEVRFRTALVIEREKAGVVRRYPVFLAVAAAGEAPGGRFT